MKSCSEVLVNGGRAQMKLGSATYLAIKGMARDTELRTWTATTSAILPMTHAVAAAVHSALTDIDKLS